MFLTQMTYIGITTVPVAWLIFVLEYTGREQWISSRKIAMLSIVPVITLFSVATNSYHQLHWSDIYLTSDSTLAYAVYDTGSLFWLNAIYGYSLMMVSAVLLVRTFLRTPTFYRRQIAWLLVAQIVPWVGNFLYIFNLSPFPLYIDVTPLAFTITGAIGGWSLYRHKLLDLVPVAHDTIFKNMSDAVVVLDVKNRVVDINQAALELIGTKAQLAISKNIATLLPNQDEIVEKYRNVIETDDEIDLTLAGKTHTFMMRLSAIKNRQGEVSGRIVTLHDITQLKETHHALIEAREQADEATNLKSQFLATMSHELRTPLNAIIGYTELQLTGMVGELSDIQYQYGERVLLNSKHLLSLINDVLDISKIEAGRLDLAKQPIELRSWIEGIVAQNRVLAEEKNLTFDVEIDAQLPPILYGDAVRLRQVVVNLLSNAIKFTTEGSVALEFQQSSTTTWQIVVSDTGIGIAPHKQETIFDEFIQVDGSFTREFGGTGLGLAIVRKLVLLMAGSIRINSTVEQGSTFTVILPLHTEAPQRVTA
ncbi:MAG: histidine kinase N-terminal 7TM domain-containing protein [Anaerolineae bacterium]|nr:histidine kinase N-terminal 7TM domain-containing protein [Anaerolineae bacterium]